MVKPTPDPSVIDVPPDHPLFHFPSDFSDRNHTNQRLAFRLHGLDNQPIFSVNSGVASEDAWTKLSHLLTYAHASASEMCDVRVVDPGLLGATVHCIEGANAWVDALLIRG
jgi:hypothetical protein